MLHKSLSQITLFKETLVHLFGEIFSLFEIINKNLLYSFICLLKLSWNSSILSHYGLLWS